MKLKVMNDFGILYGDHSHQFALRLMQGTRIITEDSTFIAGGGADTVSLWNKQGEAFAWLADHIPPNKADITPEQTFNGKWDPETRLDEIKAQITLYETMDIVR